MDKVAERILSSRVVVDASGAQLPLHSETVREQCEQLQAVVRELKPKYSLEVGLAYGVSTLFLCEVLQEVGAERHYVMDPFQKEQWCGIGLQHLREAGYGDLVDFYPEHSHVVLPRLLAEGVKLDFAYVDTTKLFDVVLVDLYYLLRLLNLGGVVFIDDCSGAGIRKVCRFLAQHPSWEVYRRLGEGRISPRRRVFGALVKRLPWAEQIFAARLLKNDCDLGVDAHCVGFKKVAEDERHWSWFEDF